MSGHPYASGDRLRFNPYNARRGDPVTGVVVEPVNGGDGYNLMVPLPGDPYRIIRVWQRDGEFILLEKYVAPLPPAPAPLPDPPLPRTQWSVDKLAKDYAARRLEKTRAWGEFVKDRMLRPEIDAKDFYIIFERYR